jgi:HSP20 family protein
MRFFYNDPYALRFAVEHLAAPARQDQAQPIPVDVYREGTDIVIEGALAGARLEDLELTCDEGMLTVRGVVSSQDREFAVQEIPRGAFSRTLALPAECDVSQARASFSNGILRIVIPRQREQTSHSIKVEVSDGKAGSKITMEKPEVIDAVKGTSYTEVSAKDSKRKGRGK